MSNKIIPEGYKLAAIPTPMFNWLLRYTGHFNCYRSVNEQVQDVLDSQFYDDSINVGWVEWYVREGEPWKVPVKKVLVSEYQFDTLKGCQEHLARRYHRHVQISDILAFYIFSDLQSELHVLRKGSYLYGVVCPKEEDVIQVRLGTGGRSTYMVETK